MILIMYLSCPVVLVITSELNISNKYFIKFGHPAAYKFGRNGVGLSLSNADGLSRDNSNGWGLELLIGIIMYGLPIRLGFPPNLDAVAGFLA